MGVLICAVLALFLISSVNPWPNYVPATIVTDPQSTKDFALSADGDESSQSLTVFAETLDDDVLLYPDAGSWIETISYCDEMNGTTESGSLASTYENDSVRWEIKNTGANASIDFFFTSSLLIGTISSLGTLTLDVYVGPTTIYTVYAYNYTASDWDSLDSKTGGAEGDYAFEIAMSADYLELNATDYNVHVRLVQSEMTEDPYWDLILDYANLNVTMMYMNDIFTEDFADVSEINATLGETVTTDGDLGTFHHPGDNAWDYYFWNAPSALAVQVIEWRCHANISSSSYEFALYSADDGGGSQLWTSGSITAPTSAGTKKYSPMVTGVESIRLATRHASSPAAFIFDYLRGSLSTEAGWAHDGSTTAAVEEFTNSEYDYYISTDGDILNMTSKRGTGDDTDYNAYYKMYYDTTSTALDLENTYYQFLEFRYRVADPSGAVWIYAYMDGKIQAQHLNEDGEWHTERINIAAAGAGSSLKYIRWSLDYTYADGSVATLLLDYAKYYSIANFTVSLGNDEVTDYIYVESSRLYIYNFLGTSEYIILDHDPALSVDGDTYTVYNVTTDMNDASGEFEYYDYVGSWSSAKDEYRGATTSGTITDVKIIIRTQATAALTRYISAVEFIEDGTAPAVVRSSSTPNDPEDDETVTLSAVITDAVEVYSVAFNAIVYPTGFSDVDYDATEQADNLWTYEFSSLITGYYCFKIIASDGANENALTEYAYIEITVREAQIRITTYTFFGASSDFTYMQYSGFISHDCTYNISEWSTSWAKNETHTGSVTKETMFNIAWDKIGVNDIDANFTIVFVSGDLSLTINGFYATAYKALQVTEIDFVNLEQSDSWTTNLTINFYTNKEVDWTVYDRDDDDAVLHSGTTTEGDGFITWVQNTARGAHRFAVKWTDGISDQWYNNSYWVFDRNIDDLPGGADPGADQRRTIEFWATVAGIAGILGIMVIGLSHYNLDEKIKNLPNYRTQERGRR